MDFFLEDAGLPRVPPDLVESCEGPLSVREAQEAISSMKNSKSPGSDGLGAEFYKKFFYLFGEKYVAVINLCFFNGRLTESQRLSLITLLCKNKELHYLPINWRPISLMNVDAKIVSKSMCNRLKKVLPYIISIDQTCSIEGRSISDNVHLLRNIFDYVEDKNVGCAWLNFDQFKAFDRIEHVWLMRVLNAFGFGPDFIQWVGVLYTDLKCSVIVNGHISTEFIFSRGVRQGCPLSPLLYVCCIEPFSNKIRTNPDIKGLPIPGDDRESKITQYADDNTMTLIDVKSMAICFDLFELYARASGSELNRGKTKGIWLGKFKDRGDTPFGIEWISKMKMLGIFFGHGNLNGDNWNRIFKGFCQVLTDNQTRQNSFYGRAIIANSLAISKIVYAAQHVILPPHLRKQFVSKLGKFVWRKKANENTGAPININTLYAPVRDGGINLVSIEIKCKALLIKHIFRIIQLSLVDPVPKWVSFAIYWVGLGLREYNEDFSSNLRPHCMDFRPVFYKNAYKFFKDYMEFFPPTVPNFYVKTVKQIYVELMSHVKTAPRVTIITLYPELHKIDFRVTWQCISSNFLDPELKRVDFLIAHRQIALHGNLDRHYERPRGEGYNCQLCRPFRVTPETIEHFFFDCYQISRIWDWVAPKLFGLCNHRLKICKEEILYYQFPKSMPSKSREMLVYIISLVKYSAWMFRIAVKFFGRNTGERLAVIEGFKARLKNRIRADFIRFDEIQFADYWAKNEILCKIEDEGSKLIFLF